jgi:5-hydroxyisourate hydrolase-like protein (transthyretin family)
LTLVISVECLAYDPAGAARSASRTDTTTGGAIRGTVASAANGLPLAGVTLIARLGATDVVATATTNELGQYEVSGLAAGGYWVRTSNGSGFVDAWFGGETCSSWGCPTAGGSAVWVVDGSVVESVNFALVAASYIKGHVRAAVGGAPVPAVPVFLGTGSGNVWSTYSDETGAYETPPLPPGTYYMSVTTAFGYLGQVYSGFDCLRNPYCGNSRTPIPTTAGQTVTGVDFALTRGGGISGHVKDAATGSPLAGVAVGLYDGYGSPFGLTGTTDTDGNYVFLYPIPAGTYYLQVSETARGYVTQVYKDVNCPSFCLATTGVPVTVSSGATTSGVDFALVSGGRITGRVYAAGVGTAFGGAVVEVYSASGQYHTYATTDAAGVYTTSKPLAAGDYYLFAKAPAPYLNQTYAGLSCGWICPSMTTGTAVRVALGSDTTGIDFPLVKGGVVSGLVSDAVTGAPLVGVRVDIYVGNQGNAGQEASGTTGSDGRYVTTPSLPTGTYYAATPGLGAFLGQVYVGRGCGLSCEPVVLSGTPVGVTQATTTSGVDFALVRGGVITGKVTDQFDGTPIAAVDVQVFRADGSAVTSVPTDIRGIYATTLALPTGTYYAIARGQNGYFGQIYGGPTCGQVCDQPTTGKPISVTQAATTSGIDFALAGGSATRGTIRGTIRDAVTGSPVPGIAVTVSAAGAGTGTSAVSDENGVYTTVSSLRAGQYYLQAEPPFQSPYLKQLYLGLDCTTSCPGTGTAVTVTGGQVTAGIDFSLTRGGTISGRVTSASSGMAIAGASVRVIRAGVVWSGVTDSNGLYSTTTVPLAAGSYHLLAEVTGYLRQMYAGMNCGLECPIDSSNAVVVAAGATISNINFSLSPGATVSGSVTALGTGEPLSGRLVSFVDGVGRFAGSGTTNPDGSYVALGLPTGTYYATVSGGPGFLGQVYRNVDCGTSCPPAQDGTPLNVTAGATTAGIDFALRAVPKPPSITTTALAPGKGGVAYSQLFTATGGASGYSWTHVSGAWPPGLTLSSDGALTGTPLEAGTYGFRIRVTGTDGAFAEGDFALTIDPFRRYFAEGASSGFFDCYFALVNPSETTTATVTFTFLRSDAQTVVHTEAVPPRARRTVNVKGVPGMWFAPGFSTVLESNVEVVADRTMSWDSAGYGSHAETSIAAPAQTWYLAEGATQNGFQLYYCIENPNPDPVDLEVVYLRRAPNPPLTIAYPGIPGHSRKTIYVNGEDPQLAWSDVSGVIRSLTPDQPIIVERAMYLDSQGLPFSAGHASAGVTAPATDWFLAEGATVGTFDMYITLANPGDTSGTAAITYMLTDGRTVVKSYPVAASSRQTVWVNGERDDLDPTLALSWKSLSASIHSDVPVIVERSMWWSAVPGGPWIEAHNAVGTTETGTVWAAADGEEGGSRNTETYVVVANTSPFPGRVRVTALDEDGAPQLTERDVPALSRTTFWMGGTAVTADSPFGGLLAEKKFGVIVESLATVAGTAQIVVERATYSNANGVAWAAGTDVVATKLK